MDVRVRKYYQSHVLDYQKKQYYPNTYFNSLRNFDGIFSLDLQK